ncbi:PilN family type IVB pilus formation outer membrane protein [Pseudomonas sp. AB12(2023)]|uniref:PilN family type IVB pilus formation outer membrane protein n=1 Tax=Pseudomonas sp. AB12(2023) TaxID=3048597 RepID=UPI002B23A3F3|nr:PilN family type IVB pilus formation outer membrane protein [Pseudomonas sp. AB12(2023)]MEB0222089.1 PilN family type IVB pilus formation outer membrane protein [Pseudomonas sp. AB12(2023)]
MKIRRNGGLPVALVLLLLLSGCEVMRVNQTVKDIDGRADEAANLAGSLRDPKQLGKPTNSVNFQDKPLVNLEPLEVKVGIPSRNDCNITFNIDVDVMDFAQAITKNCGLAVRVTPDVMDGGVRQTSGQPSMRSAPPAIATNDMSGLFPGGSSSIQGSGASGARNTRLRGINYTGPLSGLLDVATSQLGLSWKFNASDRSITIFYLTTRTYNFYAFASSTDMQSVVQSGTTTAAGTSGSGGSSSGGSGSGSSSGVSGFSGSNQSTSLSIKTSITDDIEQNIKTMLSSVGRMSLSRSTGMVMVTDRPDVLDQVGVYLAAENVNITKQVLLNVKVYSVTLTDSDSVGIDWNLVYKATHGSFGLSNTFQDSATNPVSGNIGILSGPFAGSSVILQALSQQGRVSVITEPSVTTLNLQPVPVQVARQTTYLAATQTTSTAQVGSTTSLTPGTVTSGFNMDLLPFVMPNNELLLKFSVNISTLIRLTTITSGDNQIQGPEIDNRIFSQQVKLKSGETLVLSGFDQTSDTGTKSGVGAAWNFLLGGGASRAKTRDVIVVMITPIIKG